MIDENKLIEILEDYKNNEWNKELYTSLPMVVDDCIDFVENQPKIGGWIPCSERLPDNIENDSTQYLITVKVGEDEYEIDFGWWSKISKYDNCKKKWVDYFGWTVRNDWDEGQGMEVIAWQPLPEPYKGDEENEN